MYTDNCDEIAEINAQVELWVSPDFAGEQPNDYKLVENQEATNCHEKSYNKVELFFRAHEESVAFMEQSTPLADGTGAITSKPLAGGVDA